jgi:uncharacterized damage-inducible protein DinB
MRFTIFLLTMSAITGLAAAQDSMTDAGAGWAAEFKMAGRQIVTLAEAIPADKYGWRPGPGVRSVSEVLMHTASANYFFLRSMGVTAGEDLPKDPGKKERDRRRTWCGGSRHRLKRWRRIIPRSISRRR